MYKITIGILLVFIRSDIHAATPFSVDGSAIYVSSVTENVGIGTTNPFFLLEVSGSSSKIRNTATSSSVRSSIILQDDVGTTLELGQGGSVLGNRGSIIENGSEVISLSPTGNVGIGTTSPSHLLQLGSDDAAKPTSNTWIIASDKRLKKSITAFNDGLSVIMQINPVKYQLNGKAGLPKDAEGVSVIAEDMQKVAPYTVKPWLEKAWDPKTRKDITVGEYLGFDSSPLTFVLINAIKEQQGQIEAQQKQIDVLTAEIKALKK